MNQEKIGRFIADLRKKKNLTQEKLAEKLGVTKNAVSKWERGICLMDMSLLKPLSEILGVSINELLSGEELNKDEYQDKFEENILNTIEFTNKQNKKYNKTFKIILGVIILIIILVIILFCIDVNRMNNNKPVLFSTWTFKYVPNINISDENIENTIKSFN